MLKIEKKICTYYLIYHKNSYNNFLNSSYKISCIYLKTVRGIEESACLLSSLFPKKLLNLRSLFFIQKRISHTSGKFQNTANMFSDHPYFLWWGLKTTPTFVTAEIYRVKPHLIILQKWIGSTSLPFLNATYASFYKCYKKFPVSPTLLPSRCKRCFSAPSPG